MNSIEVEPPSDGPDSITFIGHSSLLIAIGRDRILTDPIFSARVARLFTKRSAPMVADLRSLARPSSVFISHCHHDHLDYPSLKQVGKDTPLIVPWGIAPLLRVRGYQDVKVLRAWQQIQLASCKVTAVPARHFGGRLPLIYTTGCLGYVFQGTRTIYFAGDTGFDEALFREIAARFRIDLAILPIAGYVFPSFRRNHMNAEDALEAFRLLGAKRMMPIHFEAFHASFESIDSPRLDLNRGAAERGVSRSVLLPSPGQPMLLDPLFSSPEALLLTENRASPSTTATGLGTPL